MVGYRSGEEGRRELPVGADCRLSPLVPGSTEPPPDEPPPVRRVVCSRDMPTIFTPTVPPAPADSTIETLQCPSCKKSFTARTVYQAHLKTHKEGEGSYQCNFCQKTFAVPARLTRHYRTHTGEKPYQCEYCSKSFSVKENLSVHWRIHTKERPHKCGICQRAFEHSGKLRRHMPIHTGQRPHKCTVCNKTFIQSGQLIIHMRAHTGAKPYVCKDCGKGFTCSKQLKVHYRSHSGEKPYPCNICGKSFGYNHVLKLHQVAHYGEKVYKCTICNKILSSKKTMDSHIKSHSKGGRAEETGSQTEIETPCVSPASDKENAGKSVEDVEEFEQNDNGRLYPNIPELCGYMNEKPSGLNPALMATVAVATSENGGPEYTPSPDHVLETPGFSGTEPPVYLMLEPVALLQQKPSHPEDELLGLANFEEEEEVAEDPLLTPPSSNSLLPASNYPVSNYPLPESSPEPMDIKEVPQKVKWSLPPRKRSKAILKSMETEKIEVPVRYSSVIHYAKAS